MPSEWQSLQWWCRSGMTALVPNKVVTVNLLDPDEYTTDRLADMSDADLDLLIAEIGSLDEEDEAAYDDVLERAVRLISDRRER